MQSLAVKAFYDSQTSALTYVVNDSASRDAVIIDPIWDYDPASSRVSTTLIDRVCQYIEELKLTVHLLLETHAHADHLSGAQVLKQRFPEAKTGIGSQIVA